VLEEAVRGVPAAPSYYAVSGREQAQAWQRGDLPATPLARLVGYIPTQVGSGSATLRLPASPWLQYAEGTVDVKILVDEAMQVAVLTGAAPATRVVTASMSVHHLRPSTVESESFVARARVLNSGSAFTTAEAVVEDALGRAVAHVTGAYVLRELSVAPGANGGFPAYDEPTYATPDPHLRPSPPAVPLASMSMADGARGMAAGEVEVPINRLLGVRLLEFGSDGAGMLAMPASPWLCSLWTDVQPGVIAAMMHMGLGIAPVAHTRADEYIGIVSQELTFLTAVPADGRELTAPFKLVHEGDLLVSSIEVLDGDGNRVAMGSQTSVLRERRRRTRGPAAERILATVLFTDIVGSTERAQELGDERWRELLTAHQDVVRRKLKAFGGREVKTTGDGFLAAFESPARAVQCARAVRDAVRALGLEIRAGVHTGECERIGSDLAGIAVHAAARIEAAAGAGEILVSSTVCDLVAGSGLTFADRGLHDLKGLSGQRQLFAVAD
jgi:uncharacterized protein (TIGR00369 family)